MNLSLGEIELNGILFSNDTSIDEVFANSKFISHFGKKGSISIFKSEQIIVDGYKFNIKIVFINNQLDNIRMTPVNLEKKDPRYPDEKYQNEKKKVCDAFLRKHLGEPLKESEEVVRYAFDWGSVRSIVLLSGRNEFTGGFVEIKYKR